MELHDILSMTPETLAQAQLGALKKDAKSTLSKVISAIDNDDFSTIKAMTQFSGSGDGWGDENYFIQFHLGDIMETVEKMEQLHRLVHLYE